MRLCVDYSIVHHGIGIDLDAVVLILGRHFPAIIHRLNIAHLESFHLDGLTLVVPIHTLQGGGGVVAMTNLALADFPQTTYDSSCLAVGKDLVAIVDAVGKWS